MSDAVTRLGWMSYAMYRLPIVLDERAHRPVGIEIAPQDEAVPVGAADDRVERRRRARRREGRAPPVRRHRDRRDIALSVAVVRDAVGSAERKPHVVVVERGRVDRVREVEDRVAVRLGHEEPVRNAAAVPVEREGAAESRAQVRRPPARDAGRVRFERLQRPRQHALGLEANREGDQRSEGGQADEREAGGAGASVAASGDHKGRRGLHLSRE